jgi:hypothetical protein
MKLKVVFLFLLAAILISCKNTSDVEYITLSGIVMDFNKSPVDSAVLKIKNKDFDDMYETFTDTYGRYSLKAKRVFTIRYMS